MASNIVLTEKKVLDGFVALEIETQRQLRLEKTGLFFYNISLYLPYLKVQSIWWSEHW